MKTLTNPATGTAHGKIILMGEHSVVYGQPAIAVPFPAVSVTVTITPSAGPVTIESDYFNGELAEAPAALENLQVAVREACAALSQEPADFHLRVDSTIPPERGMGSSAAVAAAIVRSIFNYFNEDLPYEQLLDMIDSAEKIAHGNPSGIDARMTSSETPIYYQKGSPFERVDFNLDAYMIVADTGQKGQTLKTVGDVGVLSNIYIEEAAVIHQRLGNLVDNARAAIEAGDAVQLGEYMRAAHSQLMTLTVSNKKLDHLVAAALFAGALGAKLTGGGRGGCMIALAGDKETALTIAEALEEAGADQTWITPLGAD